MNKAKCPMCGADVTIGKSAKLGTIVICGECEAELEVVSLKPLELDWPLDNLEEDEEDDFDDFDIEEEDEIDGLDEFEEEEEDLDVFEDEDEDEDDDY